MIEIKDILSKIGDILLKEEGKIDSVRKIIEQVIGVKIQPKDIKIKNHTIYLNLKPIYKNEIYLKQEEISLQIEKMFSKKVPQKIR